MELKCCTCGINVISEEGWVRFACPACGKTEFIRCKRCRKLRKEYECAKCGFIGP